MIELVRLIMEQLQFISVERLGIPSMQGRREGGGQLGHFALGPTLLMGPKRSISLGGPVSMILASNSHEDRISHNCDDQHLEYWCIAHVQETRPCCDKIE